VVSTSPKPRVVAFFLPQFHAIPENDAWWGEGFTEWTNVRKAEPLFHGHDHPRRPAAEYYFDLTDRDELERQSRQAREHGVDAFCVYFYWFNGQRLLERPLELLASLPDPMPYMLSWANENWSRRWDGREHEVLMRQEYSPETAGAIFADFLPHFRRPQYLRRDGRPMLMVHRTDLLPDPAAFAEKWRELARDAGLPGLYLVAAETRAGIDPREWGFNAMLRPPTALDRSFSGRLLSYHRMMREALRRPAEQFVLHRGVMPGWDNTARRGAKATIVVGHSPRDYHHWLGAALKAEAASNGADGVVFVNAWNEWAEGAYLQPDASNGSAYLDATRAAVEGEPYQGPCSDGALNDRALRSLLHRGHQRSLLNTGLASALGVLRTAGRRWR
jgi:lipopolysaccharide biosynthesis protein